MKKKKISELEVISKPNLDDHLTINTANGLKRLRVENMLVKVLSETSLNNLTEDGAYQIANNALDIPAGSAPYGFVLVFGSPGSLVIQMYFDTSNNMFHRHFSSGAWKAWRKVTAI